MLHSSQSNWAIKITLLSWEKSLTIFNIYWINILLVEESHWQLVPNLEDLLFLIRMNWSIWSKCIFKSSILEIICNVYTK